MTDQVTGTTATESGSNAPATYRLVIRATIIPEAIPSPAPSHSNRRIVAGVVAGCAALLALIWVGISVIWSDSATSYRTTNEANESAREGRSQSAVPAVNSSAPVISTQSAPLAPLAQTNAVMPVEARSTDTKAVTPAEPTQQDTPPMTLDAVVPDVPRSALQTIRGTVRVSVRVTIDKHGAVVAATPDDPGPSRYFERLSLDASRKWTFSPASSDEPRNMILRFDFTRDAATARAGVQEMGRPE